MRTQIQADWYSPPGATIQDALREKKLGLGELAVRLGQSHSNVEKLISGQLQINYDLAISLADVIGASPRFWMQREQDYRADQRRLTNPSVDLQKQWLSKFPVPDMMRYGWLPQSRIFEDRFKSCLNFFGVDSIPEWDVKYIAETHAVAFRSSNAFKQDLAATFAWLRYGELQATDINCKPWNKEKFKDALHDIRKLTKISDPKVFLPKLQTILADYGVAFVVARTPNGCCASGATRFIAQDKAMMLVSFRYRSDDQFWFTFFHEAAHLILHDVTHLFLEGSGLISEKEEAEANQFAQDMLVPASAHPELYAASRNYRMVMRLAVRLGISPGIVVGQMEFLKIVNQKKFSFLKRRFNWDDIVSSIH
ncbi:MAG: ImmA/IrrE family metallo-endopeptidase [Alphaproteobacteria bacterium]|nr:ImmA/IrrE family metallo-endopeptidase [Alphaproteobacteria bacterium]